ncbi:MAG: hypothetical protein LBD22_02040, partial [Spirochaetaceae bacterium]|nr:hypothetical protein [Spirochaetaceae bacterium]
MKTTTHKRTLKLKGVFYTLFLGVMILNGACSAAGSSDSEQNVGISTVVTKQSYKWQRVIMNSTSPPFFGSAVRALAFGNGMFVAGSDIGMISWSTDGGSTWGTPYNIVSVQAAGTDISIKKYNTVIRAIKFLEGKFVAVGNSGLIAWSSDPSDGNSWNTTSSVALGTTDIETTINSELSIVRAG